MVPRRSFLRALTMPVAVGVAGCNTLTGDDSDGTPARGRLTTATPTTALTPTSTPNSGTVDPTETPTGTPSTTPTPTVAEVVGTPALTHGSGGGVDEFGRAVALSEESAVVVAEEHGAYVFEADDGWTETAVLKPDESEDFGGYNVSAAVVGDVALVGGPGADSEPSGGAVYLFERVGGEWIQRHRFVSDDEDSYEFGRSVAFDGDRVVVGDAHDPETMVTWIGGAYVFEGDSTNWTQEASLGTGAQDLFGTSVAIDGDAVLVGAPYAEPGEEQTGAVYVHERVNGEWQRETILSPAEPNGESLFGRSVALDGDTAVVGAPGTHGDKGSVYVFRRTGDDWIRQARVTAPNGGSNTDFGQSVAFVGDIAVVGAPGAYGTGRAYVFRADDDWTGALRLVAADPHEDAEFGSAVAVSDTAALVGSPVFDGASAAYLFDV